MVASDASADARAARRLSWILRLSSIEVGLTLATAALVTLGGSSGAVQCPSFPSCLTSQGTIIASIHQIAAGILLLLALVVAALAVSVHSRPPPVLAPAVLGTVALGVTATFGMLFAAGAVPASYAPIQYVFLTVVVAAFAVVAVRSYRWKTGSYPLYPRPAS